jgi:hypothetical protein
MVLGGKIEESMVEEKKMEERIVEEKKMEERIVEEKKMEESIVEEKKKWKKGFFKEKRLQERMIGGGGNRKRPWGK